MSEIHLGGVTVLKFYVLHAVHFFDDLGSMRQMYTCIFYYSIHIFHWRWSNLFRNLYEVHLQGYFFKLHQPFCKEHVLLYTLKYCLCFLVVTIYQVYAPLQMVGAVPFTAIASNEILPVCTYMYILYISVPWKVTS
jgi:hypothetical protein